MEDVSKLFGLLNKLRNNVPLKSDDLFLSLYFKHLYFPIGQKQIIFTFDENVLSKSLGNGSMSEEQFVTILLQTFKNIKNFSISRPGTLTGAAVGCYFNDKISSNEKLSSEVSRIIGSDLQQKYGVGEQDRITKKETQKVSNGEHLQPDKNKESSSPNPIDVSKFNPDQIVAKLKKKIIGQDRAVTDVIDTLLLNQLVIDMNDSDMLKTSKANILLDGPTGTGKTFLIKEATELLNIPMVIASATSFSTTGYKGDNLESLLITLLDRAKGDLELAQRGIIVLDEFDKLGNNNEHQELAIRKGLQEELLTYLSGATFKINYEDKQVEFDTSKITFVGMGAFTKLRERKIAEKEGKKMGTIVGFGMPAKTTISSDKTITIGADDYISEGLSRELIGRFTTITNTDPIDKEGLIRIMKESATSPLLFIKELARRQGKNLIISDDVIEYIAETALEMNTGARALQTVFSPIQRSIARQILSGNELDIEISMEMVKSLQKLNVRSY